MTKTITRAFPPFNNRGSAPVANEESKAKGYFLCFCLFLSLTQRVGLQEVNYFITRLSLNKSYYILFNLIDDDNEEGLKIDGPDARRIRIEVNLCSRCWFQICWKGKELN